MDPLPSIDQVFGSADGILSFLQPYYRRLIVERRTIIDTAAQVSAFDKVKQAFRNQAWENQVSFFTGILYRNWWFDIYDRIFNLELRSLEALGGLRGHRSDSMLDFKWKRRWYYDFTFWAIPVSQWHQLLPAYFALCDRYRHETGFRASLITEIYMIRRDTQSLLSFSAKEDVFTLDLADSRTTDPLWLRLNREVNQPVAAHGGRPLLNQTKELERSIVYQAFPEEWPQFLAIRQQHDPAGRFLTAYFKALA
jgi:FAD/FMN-containing dehydrogenase